MQHKGEKFMALVHEHLAESFYGPSALTQSSLQNIP